MNSFLTLPWEKQLFLSLFNFLFGLPAHMLPGIYDRKSRAYKQLVAITFVRICVLYIGVLSIYFTFRWIVSFTLITLAIALYGVEVYGVRTLVERSITKKFSKPNRVKEFALFAFVSLDVVNFLTDSTSRTDGWVQAYLHIVQIGIRIIIIIILVVIEITWVPYQKAWSCYIHGTSVAQYTKGYCPALTHDWANSWACAGEGVGAETLACRDTERTPAWTEKPPVWHILSFLLFILYGFHAVSLVLDFKTKKMQILV
jgi:hypothetical protein